jgi:hypothetical protein
MNQATSQQAQLQSLLTPWFLHVMDYFVVVAVYTPCGHYCWVSSLLVCFRSLLHRRVPLIR